MTTAAEVVALALTKVGYRYSTGPSRTTGADGYFDCSGFTFFLLEHLGIRPPDWQPQSHLQALYDRDHGLLLTINQAIGTAGALLYEGPQHAYVGGAGIPGHVAVSLGNGHTVEAMGHAWGTCIGGAFGRGWSNAGLFPNIDYTHPTPAPPHPDPVDNPLIGDDMALVIPSRARIDNGRTPYATLDVQGSNVLCFNGMRIHWRMPDSAPQQKPVKFGDALVYDVPLNKVLLGMDETKDHKTLLPDNLLCVTAADGGCAFADISVP